MRHRPNQVSKREGKVRQRRTPYSHMEVRVIVGAPGAQRWAAVVDGNINVGTASNREQLAVFRKSGESTLMGRRKGST